jgi:ketosteroid isomerase-like protein
MGSNLEKIRSTYEGSSAENGKRLHDLLASDVEWIEAAGFPYGGTYRGPDAVRIGVFVRLASEWDQYRAIPDAYYECGDTVIVTGTYDGTYLVTGRSMRASFAHVWKLLEGKIVRFEQYVDSAQVRDAMS